MGSETDVSPDPKSAGGRGIFSLDRLLGFIMVAFAAWLLIFGIPANVNYTGTQFPKPHLFPQIGAWVIMFGGLGQIVVGNVGTKLPPRREMARFGLVALLVVGMVFLMISFGYLVGGMALIAVLMFVVFEKRPFWIFVAVVAVPAFTWVFFEKILERPLP